MTKSNQTSDHAESKTSQDRFHGASEQLAMAATSVKETAMECGNHYVAEPARDLIGLLQDYARTRPEVAAAWCFGIGLFLGWKLRP
jgi:ElaB/YqjD/DUF883 family membrane-anchored ribosome-binding protein